MNLNYKYPDLKTGYSRKRKKAIVSKNHRSDYYLEEAAAEAARLHGELEAALQEAREAIEAKDIFLANMSHEMRTPLNAIICLSELMLSAGDVTGEAEGKLEIVYTSGVTLLGIVNDILDISKIESGKFKIHPVEYDVPSLINDIMTLNSIRKGDKPIVFKLVADEDLPARVFGDDLRIKQIFNNLLSNAFKYTNSGEVEWRIAPEPDESDRETVWFVSSVSDTGKGIRPKDLRKLFIDYSQIDRDANRAIEGIGLGLSITKHLVEMMDGTIWVESEYGKGSVFHVRIRQKPVTDMPIGAGVAANLADVRYTVSKRDRTSKTVRINMAYARVLVVDDVPANLEVAKGMLSPYEIRVDCAASGMEAIEMIRAGNPRYDAVFMDHMMPGMDGVEAMRIIREEIGTDYARNIPVIVLTANAITGSEEMFLEKGFSAFLSKPINLTELDSVLRFWVRDKKREKELLAESMKGAAAERGPLDNTPADAIKIDGVDTAHGLARFGNDSGAYIAVLRSYAETTGPILESLKAYQDAGDLENYAIAVHGVKGSSRSIGAELAGNAAESLEYAAKDGDAEKVRAENGPFTEAMGELLGSASAALAKWDAENGKPPAEAPDPALLGELREACRASDMDRVDTLMAQLESFAYKNGNELVAWLHEQVAAMNFRVLGDGVWRYPGPASKSA